jgi:hypothetical protein
MDLNTQQNEILYTVLVAGDVDLSKYDKNIPVSPYVAYKYSERSKIKEVALQTYSELYKKFTSEKDFQPMFSGLLLMKLQDIEEMTDEEYFEEITKGMKYDENGDAITEENPNGKFSDLLEPSLLTAVPLKDTYFKCKVSELYPYKVNIFEQKKCEERWDDIMSGEYAPMVKESLISRYGNKETYVKVMMEPMFYNAFVSEETGWLEQSDEDQIQWVINFRERFIKNLSEETNLRVYNFKK